MDSLDEYTQWFENLPEEAQLYWEYDWFCEMTYIRFVEILKT